MSHPAHTDDRRETILDAAETLFAEKGFDGTSIREITSRADCNLAAVNYYFRSKEELYYEVFMRCFAGLRDKRIHAIEHARTLYPSDPPLQQLIRAFAAVFLEPAFFPSRGGRVVSLMIQEMTHPRLSRELFLEQVIAPVKKAFGQHLTAIFPSLRPQCCDYALFSIVGQLLHICRVHCLFQDVSHPDKPEIDYDSFLNHVVAFSAAGIEHIAGEGAGR